MDSILKMINVNPRIANGKAVLITDYYYFNLVDKQISAYKCLKTHGLIEKA